MTKMAQNKSSQRTIGKRTVPWWRTWRTNLSFILLCVVTLVTLEICHCLWRILVELVELQSCFDFANGISLCFTINTSTLKPL